MVSKQLKGFIHITSLFTSVTTICFFGSSCSKSENNYNYDFVSLDPNLTGNLAALGFKPTIQSLYNDETRVADYIANLNVVTQTNQQPTSANAELWLSRNVKVMYGYSFNQSSALQSGAQHFITHHRVMNDDIISNLENNIDASALGYAKTWNLRAELLNLANQLNELVKNPDYSSIFEDGLQNELVNRIQNNLDQKLNLFKQSLNQTNLSISFWGMSYGPNWVHNPLNFSEYGPSTSYPGWLFDATNSLGFVPSVPSDEQYQLSVKPLNGINTFGWHPKVGTYEPKAVQKAFAKSSDYVVVAIDNTINNATNVSKIKTTFYPMLKDGLSERNIIVVDANQFSLNDFNFLGVEYSLDVLAQNILKTPQRVLDSKIFNTNNLRTLSTNEFIFKTIH